MNITKARYEKGQLILDTPDIHEAMRFAVTFKAGEHTIAPAKKKRSKDANAYAWALIDELAAALRLPKSEIYQNAIREIGGVSDTVHVKEEAVKRLCERWGHTGLGWVTDIMPSSAKGYVYVVLYYGSSSYDTAQMSRFIDHLVQDCKALNIETLTPDKQALLLEKWNEREHPTEET